MITNNWTLLDYHVSGAIRNLAELGIIQPKVVTYFEYYDTFMKYRKEVSYRQAILNTSVDHKVSQETIKRAVRLLTRGQKCDPNTEPK